MNQAPLVSIIINNYNYSRFLKDAVDSALNQMYTFTEVIVVDDGSTDGSVAIINEYGDRIIAVLKKNEGQASAFNEGFIVSSGEIIIFLDSDDVLLPTATAKCAEIFCSSEKIVSQVHWSLWEMNEYGQKNGHMFPSGKLPEGDLRNLLIGKGPGSYMNSPTSGNAWSREFLSKILPMPASTFKISADGYLFMLAPLFGSVKVVSEPQSFYRIHGGNNFKGKLFKENKLNTILNIYDHSCKILEDYFRQSGITVDINIWKLNYWYYKILESINEIKEIVPRSESFILADEEQWDVAEDVAGRKVIPFIEHNGIYWGPPPDDSTAIEELERQRKSGAFSIMFTWSTFWYLDYYKDFNRHLMSSCKCVLHNERLICFLL